MDLFDVNTYDFELPQEQIAQYPARPRDASRLLVVDRKAETLHDSRFSQLAEWLRPGDVLALNETKVIPARLLGQKADTGARVEIFLLNRRQDGWACLVRPAKRLKPGARVVFAGGRFEAVIERELDFAGGRQVRFDGDSDWEDALREIGQMPLPPYIQRPAEPSDQTDYQTVFASHAGSVAAPTAGLHFTDQLFAGLAEQGIEPVHLVLHVGLGTFRPVEARDIRDHRMHSEYYEISGEAAAKLNQARADGRRVIAVGTTVVRTLESAWHPDTGIQAGSGETDIFIYPGSTFHAVDGMITNFHLPKSSLLMLVSAFGGIELVRKAYQHALTENYQFFSYGDAMFIR